MLNTFPADAYTLSEVEPIYETFEGWEADLGSCRRFDDLPPQLKAYIEQIEKRVGAPVGIVSVGPDREQTICREDIA